MPLSGCESRLNLAQGCLFGQLIGDSLGGLVEFQSPEQVHAAYPNGVRDLANGGTWNTLAGQPTDDSEMALALAHSLIERGTYDRDAVRNRYVRWLDSSPFDIGATTANGLRGNDTMHSQANGALMRVSPLGIFGALRCPEHKLVLWSDEDAGQTHSNPVCGEANVLFVLAIANAIKYGPEPREVFAGVMRNARFLNMDRSILQTVISAVEEPPADYITQQGWVLIALQNALYQLLHARSFEEAIVDTVARGGDTDTNAAICGALLGAVHGYSAIPYQWGDAVLSCRPAAGRPGVNRPRPREYWPTDVLSMADLLLGV